MPTAKAASLDEVARRIAQQQTELEALRKEYESRQAQLTDLARRQQELKAELAQVESEIQTVKRGGTPSSAPASAKPPHAKKAAVAPPSKPRAPGLFLNAKKAAIVAPSKPAPPMTLPMTLVALVRESGRPMTVKQLTDELVRRKFPTTSKHLGDVVQSRVGELVKKGLLRRAKDQPGVVPGEGAAVGKANPQAAAQKPAQKTSAAKQSPERRPGQEQPSLREVLVRLLQKSKQPLTGSELAKQARAAGYHSKSKDFVNVVWVALGKMDSVESIAGKGYRLKSR